MSKDIAGAESFGVLIGWAHHAFGSKLELTLQSVRSTRRDDPRDVDDHHFVMTPAQAAVLANYLYKISGQSPPVPRRSWLRRLLG